MIQDPLPEAMRRTLGLRVGVTLPNGKTKKAGISELSPRTTDVCQAIWRPPNGGRTQDNGVGRGGLS